MCLGIRSAHNGIQISLAQELSREYPVVWVSNPKVYHEVVIQICITVVIQICITNGGLIAQYPLGSILFTAGRGRTIGYLTNNGVLKLLHSSESVTGVSQ